MYDAVLQELEDADGRLSLGTRESLAAEAFSYTARYDTAIARWFAEKQEDFPPLMMSAYEKVTDLAYGENPHQRAAYYAQVGSRMHVLSMVAAGRGQGPVVQQRARPQLRAAAGRGVQRPGLRDHQAQQPVRRGDRQLARARPTSARFACDPQSAFGGVVCLNRPVDGPLAELIAEPFCEVLFAPRFTEDALARARGQAEHADPRGQRAAPLRHRRARPQAA